MKIRTCVIALALALGLAPAAATAAAKTNLTATNNTVAGPGTTSIVAGESERVFFHPANTSDLCVTVVNTGRVQVDVSVTGGGAPTGAVAAGSTAAVCADDVTQVDLACLAGGANCTAQWRVDTN